MSLKNHNLDIKNAASAPCSKSSSSIPPLRLVNLFFSLTPSLVISAKEIFRELANPKILLTFQSILPPFSVYKTAVFLSYQSVGNKSSFSFLAITPLIVNLSSL